MTTKDFCYWLNGFLEVSESKEINEKQIKIIKEHLALVFKKIISEVDPPPLMVEPQAPWDKPIC